MPVRILVQELKGNGHCVPFALDTVRTLLHHGDHVTLVLNACFRAHAEAMLADEPLLAGIEVVWGANEEVAYSGPATAALEVSTAAAVARSYRPDRILIPTADAIARCVTPGSEAARVMHEAGVPWELVVHNLPPGTPLRLWTKPHHRLAARHAFDGVRGHRLLTVDPNAVFGPGARWLSRPVRRDLGFLPHRIRTAAQHSKADAREQLGLPVSGRLLIVPGVVDPRKAIVPLLDALPQLEGVIDGVVFCGLVAPELRGALERARSSACVEVFVMNRFFRPAEFMLPFVAADVVWSVNPCWPGMSSAQFCAARANRQALISDLHPSACFSALHGTGVTVIKDSIPASVGEAFEAPGPDAAMRNYVEVMTSETACERVLGEGLQIKTLEDARTNAALV
jgi:hypothetical protein